MLWDWVVSLFVDVLVGIDGGEGGMLRDGDGLCLDVIKLSCKTV